jgi:hypothetical protein
MPEQKTDEQAGPVLMGIDADELRNRITHQEKMRAMVGNMDPSDALSWGLVMVNSECRMLAECRQIPTIAYTVTQLLLSLKEQAREFGPEAQAGFAGALLEAMKEYESLMEESEHENCNSNFPN